jgi:hypothetical protein
MFSLRRSKEGRNILQFGKYFVFCVTSSKLVPSLPNMFSSSSLITLGSLLLALITLLPSGSCTSPPSASNLPYSYDTIFIRNCTGVETGKKCTYYNVPNGCYVVGYSNDYPFHEFLGCFLLPLFFFFFLLLLYLLLFLLASKTHLFYHQLVILLLLVLTVSLPPNTTRVIAEVNLFPGLFKTSATAASKMLEEYREKKSVAMPLVGVKSSAMTDTVVCVLLHPKK